ncbi:MAG: hypothetical protein M3414_03180 [Pseudomonadota bacterium]|nr:hypothetical protein [Pseudomonadota bacterium]
MPCDILQTLFAMAHKLFSADERAQVDEQYETWKASPDAMATAQAKSGMKAVVRLLSS